MKLNVPFNITGICIFYLFMDSFGVMILSGFPSLEIGFLAHEIGRSSQLHWKVPCNLNMYSGGKITVISIPVVLTQIPLCNVHIRVCLMIGILLSTISVHKLLPQKKFFLFCLSLVLLHLFCCFSYIMFFMIIYIYIHTHI